MDTEIWIPIDPPRLEIANVCTFATMFSRSTTCRTTIERVMNGTAGTTSSSNCMWNSVVTQNLRCFSLYYRYQWYWYRGIAITITKY